MKPPDHLTMGEAAEVSGYGGTALRRAFDDETQSLTGIVREVNGQKVRYIEEQSLLPWVKSRPQGERKLQAAGRRQVRTETDDKPRKNRKTQSKKQSKKKRNGKRTTGRTKAELRELIEELRTENEGQAATIEQLLGSLVYEAESHHKQLARLAQAHKTKEAAKPGRRSLQDLLEALTTLESE